MARDTGALVCINGHIPEMFAEIDSQGWDVDYYMTALYVFGRTHAEWEKLFPSDLDLAPLQVGELQTEYNSPYYGGEIAWVHGDPPKMLKVIKQAKKPCLAFKILASGNLMATAQPKVQQKWWEIGGYSALKAVVDAPGFPKSAPFAPQFLESMAIVKDFWAEPSYAQLLLDMQKRVHDYVVADKGTAQQALDLLVKDWTKVFKEQGKEVASQ